MELRSGRNSGTPSENPENTRVKEEVKEVPARRLTLPIPQTDLSSLEVISTPSPIASPHTRDIFRQQREFIQQSFDHVRDDIQRARHRLEWIEFIMLALIFYLIAMMLYLIHMQQTK